METEGLVLASFDVCSLFTNIPIKETIDIILEANANDQLRSKIDNDSLKKVLNTCTEDCVFLFNGEKYKQKDGVAMGSPLGPTLANIFMCDFEKKWLNTCPPEIKPVFYKRYVDDILLGFKTKRGIQQFWRYYNNKHPNIKFTIEDEIQGNISFLDLNIKKQASILTQA